jgi:hypothetical protein
MTRIVQVTGIKGRPLLLDGKPMHDGAVVDLAEHLIPPLPGGRKVRGVYIDGEPQYDLILMSPLHRREVVRIGKRTPELEADYAAMDKLRRCGRG